MMDRAYALITGVMFGVVALLHALRVFNGWGFEIGTWTVPMWFSWLGMVFPAILCAWGLKLASRSD